MNKPEKALLATILVSLGAGAAKLIKSVREHQRRHNNHADKRAYNGLNPVQQKQVDCAIDIIIPNLNPNSYICQKYIHEYCQVLEYASARDEILPKDTATALGISKEHAVQLMVALLQQGLVGRTESAVSYVNRNKVAYFINRIDNHFNMEDNINPKRFMNLLSRLTVISLNG